MDNLTARQQDARLRAIEALREALAAGADRLQQAAFAEVCVDAILDAATPTPSDHAASVGALIPPGRRV